jgi:hypothetical protein
VDAHRAQWVPAGLFQRSVGWGAAFSVDSAGSAVGDWRLASSSGRQRDVVPEKPCPYHDKPAASSQEAGRLEKRHGVGRDRACKGAILALSVALVPESWALSLG